MVCTNTLQKMVEMNSNLVMRNDLLVFEKCSVYQLISSGLYYFRIPTAEGGKEHKRGEALVSDTLRNVCVLCGYIISIIVSLL